MVGALFGAMEASGRVVSTTRQHAPEERTCRPGRLRCLRLLLQVNWGAKGLQRSDRTADIV